MFWHAKLKLKFSQSAPQQTILSERSFEGPLKVQKTFYPEGKQTCHAIIIHPPSGIAGGDVLAIDVVADHQSHCLLTTPGASKWYRSEQRPAVQTVRIDVGEGAAVEWLPQENIIFNQAIAEMHTQIHLADSAKYIGYEAFCLGRRASGERWDQGSLNISTDIWQQSQLIWSERSLLHGGSEILDSAIGMNQQTLCATFFFAGMAFSPALVNECRAAVDHYVSNVPPATTPIQWGISARTNILVARILHHNAELVRDIFMALWGVLRPALIGIPAQIPRIWMT